MTRKLILFVAFCFFSRLVSAQSFTTFNYTVSEGLPSNEVYEILQDKKGFMWFSTDNGVIRYDGFEMQKFGTEQGLSDPVVFGFFEDSKGRIWFRTFSGKLSYYENGKIVRYRYNDVLEKVLVRSVISAIHVDDSDGVWFSTYRDEGAWGRIDSSGQLKIHPGSDDYSIYYKEVDGVALFGYNRGQIGNILINDTILPLKLAYSCGSVPRTIPITWNNKLYLSICQEIFEWTGQNLKKVFTASAPVISLSVDNENNLWVGYIGIGADKFSSADFVKQSPPEVIKSFSITRVLSDHEGGLWFSTLEGGVFYIPNITINNFHPFDGSKILHVASSETDAFVGTNTGKIYKMQSEGKVDKVRSFPFAIREIYVTSDQKVWVGSNIETLVFDSDLEYSKKLRLYTQRITQDNAGHYWTANGTNVIHVVKKDTIIAHPLSFLCRNVMAVDSMIYLVSRSSVFVTDHSFKNFTEMKDFADFKIMKVIALNDSSQLLTTVGRGFLIYKPAKHRYTHYHAGNKFVANNIYDVVNDGNRLWFGTEAGVMGVTLTSLMQENPEIEFLSRQSGLVSNEVYNLVQIQNSLWAFSDKGFSIVDKDQTRFSNKSPQFYLKNVFINESPVTIKKEDRLRPDQNNIKLEYGFIAYNNQRIFTRHRLHTTDQWNYTSLRALQFYALAPGEYNFDVEFSTDNINWKSGYSLSSFTILPPLWKRWYFLTAFWLVVLIIIFLYFRNQLMIYRRHQQKLMESEIKTVENERSRIAKDLHDSVGTDFTAIKMMVNQEMQKYDAEKTKVIEHQFQHTLQEIKDIIYNLSPPGLERYGLLTGIHNYVDRLKGSLPIEIDLNCFGPEIKNKNISITVFRILQELISNSVKHSKAKNISLHINSFKDMLSIVYEDNGNGFVVDTQTKGLGLYNIESRVQSVSGKMKFESGSFGVSYTIDIPLK